MAGNLSCKELKFRWKKEKERKISNIRDRNQIGYLAIIIKGFHNSLSKKKYRSLQWDLGTDFKLIKIMNMKLLIRLRHSNQLCPC